MARRQRNPARPKRSSEVRAKGVRHRRSKRHRHTKRAPINIHGRPDTRVLVVLDHEVRDRQRQTRHTNDPERSRTQTVRRIRLRPSLRRHIVESHTVRVEARRSRNVDPAGTIEGATDTNKHRAANRQRQNIRAGQRPRRLRHLRETHMARRQRNPARPKRSSEVRRDAKGRVSRKREAE